MTRRPLVYSARVALWAHIVSGSAAFLLRSVSWYHAVFTAAAAVAVSAWFYRTFAKGPIATHPAAPPGLVLYPLSILLLLLLFPARPDITAASWVTLAFGYGIASLLDPHAGLRGGAFLQQSAAARRVFVLAAACSGALACWWCRPAVVPPPYVWFSLTAPVLAAVASAAVQTVPMRLDPNVSVPLSAAAVLWSVSLVSEDRLIAFFATLPRLLLLYVPLNVAVAAAGYVMGTVSASGAFTGAVIGTAIGAGAGGGAWVLLITCFACAVAATRVGLHRKMQLGVAEPHGGRRGRGNAIANTGVAAGAALLVSLSFAPDAAALAMAAALVAGASDTVASEIGTAAGGRPWALVPPGRVPPGTPGAMSLAGTAAGVGSAVLLAYAAVLLGVIGLPGVVPVVAGATVGALAESLLATAFEARGTLNNDALNFINTGLAAVVALSLRPT